MSNLEKDLNPDTFIGISLPLDYGSQGFFNQTKTTLQQVGHNIQNLLLTQKGERLGNPNFGSNLMRILFEPNNEDIEVKIEESIRSSMSEWLPFVEVIEVKVKSDPYKENQVNVKMNFTVGVNKNVQTVNINLGPDAPFGDYDAGGEDYRGEFNENTNNFY